MKLGHWILIAGAVLLIIWFMSSSSKPAASYTGGGTWYDRMLAGVGLGLGTYVRAAGPNAFGGGGATSGGVRTTNPAIPDTTFNYTRTGEVTTGIESEQGLDLGWGEMKYRDEPEVIYFKD